MRSVGRGAWIHYAMIARAFAMPSAAALLVLLALAC